jgi:hypothetical protein
MASGAVRCFPLTTYYLRSIVYTMTRRFVIKLVNKTRNSEHMESRNYVVDVAEVVKKVSWSAPA